MQRGRPAWTKRAEPALVERLHEALDAGRLSIREIWLSLNLSRWCSLRTLRDYAAERRRIRAAAAEPPVYELAERPATPATPRDPAAVAPQVMAQTLGAMLAAIVAGDVPAYAMPAYVRAMLDLRGMQIEEAAARRAAERHEASMAEMRRKQASALEGVVAATRLTPEQVRTIQEQVLGLVAEPKAAPAAPSSETAAA